MSNPKFYKKISGATSKLINCLSTFQEASENHEACKAYALSQFQHHRYLDVDSHKIERWIEGLCEKFVIHSNPDKNVILRRLKSDFLSKDLSETSVAGSQVHYAVLSILLNLSKNPVNKEYVEPVIVEKQIGEVFDWGKYLLEGEEILHPTQWACSDTPTSSEDGDLIDSCSFDNIDEGGYLKQADVLRKIASNLENLHRPEDLVSQYWNTGSNKNSVVLIKDYEFQIPSEININEMNILREVLWLLAGQKNLFIFPISDSKHNVCDEIITSHSTPEAFKSALLRIATYGDIVQNMTRFVLFSSQHECQTYQAFAESLLHYTTLLNSRLKSMERRILLHEETISLCDIIKMLSPELKELSLIDAVLKNSVDLDEKMDTNSKKSSRLLGTLYNIILDQTDVGMSLELHLKTSLTQMWIDSLRPYFEIIYNWMCFGILIDPHNEFILERSSSSFDVKSDSFWNEVIHLVSTDCLKYLSWLRPVLNNIIVAGKSVEVLVSLGKNVRKDSNKSLHDIFTRKITQGVRNLNDECHVKVDVKRGPGDELLHLNFERLFQEDDHQSTANLGACDVDDRVPFTVLIQQAFSDIICEKSRIANDTLLDVILNEHHFLSLLKCFHKFHLMEWGDVMYDFTMSIFRKISRGEYWEDLMSLRASLQESISDSSPDTDYSSVTVAINRNKQKAFESKQLIHATDVIEIIFSVKWPLNIIVTDGCRKSYDVLFSYLMQVKHALFSLENMNLGAFRSEPNTTQILHRLALLRTKLLRLVSHWHNFVMTGIIQAEKEQFLLQIATAENVDAIRMAHDKYLERMLTLCLLKETRQADKMIQGTLRKIFNLSVFLHLQWNKRSGKISHESIRKYEAEYKECSEFLGIILQNLVSRGAVPLGLESLAFCLIT